MVDFESYRERAHFFLVQVIAFPEKMNDIRPIFQRRDCRIPSTSAVSVFLALNKMKEHPDIKGSQRILGVIFRSQLPSGLAVNTAGEENCIEQWFSNSTVEQNHQEGLSEHRLSGPTSAVYDPVGLGWGPRSCISRKFPSDCPADSPEITSVNPWQGRYVTGFHVLFPLSARAFLARVFESYSRLDPKWQTLPVASEPHTFPSCFQNPSPAFFKPLAQTLE